MKKILIFGSQGFIGKMLLRRMAEIDNLAISLFDKSLDKEYINSSFHGKNILCFKGDINNHALVGEAIKNQDVIYYLVSVSIPCNSWKDPLIEVNGNLLPFISMLNMAAKSGVKKIVFISSGGTVYGTKEGLLNEDTSANPFTPHGIFKLCQENLLLYANRRWGISYDIFRVANVYGPGQNTSSGLGVINTWLEKIIAGEPLTVYGDGSKIRDFVYVDDIANILIKSVEMSYSKSGIYNMGTGKGVSLNELIRIIRDETSLDFKIDMIPARDSDTNQVVLDNSKLISEFGLDNYDFITLQKGIRYLFNYLKKD